MRVGLTHDEKTVDRIQFAALVAGHHPGRHAGCPHQEDEGRGVVFAEAAPRPEEEFVHRVLAEQGVVSAEDADAAAQKPLGVAEAGRKGGSFYPAFLDLVRSETARHDRELRYDTEPPPGAVPSADELERRRLEALEPGITQVEWGPNGEVLMPGHLPTRPGRL